MSRYTVIGAGGYIGRRLVQTLRAAGHEVFAPGRDNGELFDTDLGKVFYCAGLTGDYRTRPFDTAEAHVSLISRLLERGRFDRLVYLSSTRLYDVLTDGVASEDRALPLNSNDPRHVYELTKMTGEVLTVTQSQGRGCVARLAYVYDEVGDGFLSQWLARAAEEKSLVLDSSPGNGRDYIHLDDVIRGLKAMLDQDATGIINLASGQRLTNRAIAAVFEQRGWTIGFSQTQDMALPVEIAVDRLAALGASARPVLPLIEAWLDGLAQAG